MLPNLQPTTPQAQDHPGGGRVLVYLAAPRALLRMRSVLECIPSEMHNHPRVQFLIIEDASHADTLRDVRHWMQGHGVSNVTLLRNPARQGDGGNQKLAYRICVDQGYAFVLHLRAHDPNLPASIPRLIDAWDESRADVIIAASRSSAQRSFIERALTSLQNRLTGRALRDYRSDCRGYSAALLRRIAFETNSSDVRFDLEILLQAIHVESTIVEVETTAQAPATLDLGTASGMLLSTLRYKLQRMGMLCDLKFRHLTPQRYQDKSFMLYSSHAMALDIVRQRKPATLLDIGCGQGFIAKHCEQMGVRVTAVDSHEPQPGMMSEFHRMDLETDAFPIDPFAFDCVLMLDVIEHIADPETFLISLRNQSQSLASMSKPPLFVLSTPNVAFAAIRLNLLLGRFSYGERGILDITHKRLFTRSSLLRTLRDSGYRIETVEPVGVPFATVVGGNLGKLCGQIAKLLARVWPTMFAFQFLVTCRPTPGVRQVLSQSEVG